jgi:hypothetical protein
MSTNVLLCLFLRRDNLINGLKMLAPFDSGIGGECNGLYWLGTTPAKEIINQFSSYISLINRPKVEEDRANTPQCTFIKDDVEVTLCFTPWLQELFHISPYDQHIAITLAFCDTRNFSFLPSDHPSLDMLQFVTKTLRPILGWGTGEDIYNYDYVYQSPVWTGVRPYILGFPLSTKVKEVVDLDNPNNGLFYCKHLDNDLYWIAPPGTMEGARSSYRADPIVLQKHLATTKRIENVLKTIPPSVLNQNDR